MANEASIAILSLETGEIQPIIYGGFNARYSPTGHIIFARSGALWAVPFDLQRMEVTGTETPMVEGVQINNLLGFLHPTGFQMTGCWSLFAAVRQRAPA